ncbi:hypothetical protein [Methylobacterium oxalidis]|uniref:Uncharacterized protein n=1 Tax=Methylobacterium oxalidis TaxID=944322 RepID=A0A512IZR6_9HYPH|nr:hypothetical protein [Methylobacterium oxalidis]GEP03206.1 hypothetical protein MOX02_12440 [Methylobacterium oxalidis]GJE30853.1 hypothetical protein LDDCCGHA_1023 [Methylobacterium oxalidis]GLS67466.1 hypothetical protein GCM10007888_58500 [Methylobacterium oxalidis]
MSRHAVKPSGALPSAPAARPLAGSVAVRRAREAAVERVALGAVGLLALTASGFAGYAISTGTRPYATREVLPAQAGPFAWKKGVDRSVVAGAAQPDLDPLTTGSLPERPAAVRSPAPQPSPVPPSGYALRRVLDGQALVESRDGVRQVSVGATLPGAGRVLSIRDTGAGWIVITTETIIGPAQL